LIVMMDVYLNKYSIFWCDKKIYNGTFTLLLTCYGSFSTNNPRRPHLRELLAEDSSLGSDR
jgi:hypothetical protein